MSEPAYLRETVLGLILAGGRSRRMGGRNKALQELGGQTLAERALANLTAQTAAGAISANADIAILEKLGAPVVADTISDYAGPLAGVLAGIDWAQRNRPATQWIVSVPVDTPFIPADLVERLVRGARQANALAALAASNGATHFVCGLWSVALRDRIYSTLVERAVFRAQAIAEACGYCTVEWPVGDIDPFFNVNTPEDLAMAERMLESSRA